ncbi:ribosome biogenesis protein BMS1 [Nematocida sp. AWRm77]|nr:ribosome biogenesis protein BMS1 [Nematocida sp. AWRm77]
MEDIHEPNGSSPPQKEKQPNRAEALRRARYNESKYQVPIHIRSYGVLPSPPMVVVFGPKSSGKTLLLASLVRQYTKQRIENIRGTVTLMASKSKRLSFYECPALLPYMVDSAKIADLVILTIDATVGLEVETFEMLNLLKTHGFPKIMCAITKLDSISGVKQQRDAVKKIKKRMWTEIANGIKVFTMTKVVGGRYLDREVGNISRYLTQTKCRPFQWRASHPYVIADQVVYETEEEKAHSSRAASEDTYLFTLTGYVRGGTALRHSATFHIPGVGDYQAQSIEVLEDPCPFLSAQKKRLSERKKPLFAPTSEIRGMLVDKEKVFLDITGHHAHTAQSLPTYTVPQEMPFQLFEDTTQKLVLGTEGEGEGEEEGLSDNSSCENECEDDNEDECEDASECVSDGFSEEDVSEGDSNSHSDELTEMAVKSMFRKKEETEEEYIEKFNREYSEPEKDKRDIFTQEKDKLKSLEERTQDILQSHSEEKKLHVEGVPPGKYVKVKIELPARIKELYKPEHLLLLGANREEELAMTYIQGKVKKHKWFKRILKTKEAHYVSIGWRRFQTVPTFSIKDAVRNRMLKYIPESMSCNITFYGPSHAPGTGFCILRKLSEDRDFRIAANGIETEMGKHPKIMKKLKLVGYPSEIKGHTVFVKDMFHTLEEAARYEGASVKTVSGLRGQIKKAGANGTFRATFEGIPKMSDIVFFPCFYPITLSTAYLNAETFLCTGEIRLLKEIREEKGLPLPAKESSQYRALEEPKTKGARSLPRSVLAKTPLSMVQKEEEKASEETGSPETLLKLQALEAITKKAEALKQKRAQEREEKISAILQERKELRKRRENKMKDEARKSQQTNKKHKPAKKKQKQAGKR